MCVTYPIPQHVAHALTNGNSDILQFSKEGAAVGFLDFFKSTPSPQRFATIAVEGLRAAGHSAPIAIDPPNFRLLLGADGEVTFNLDIFYRDHCRVSKGERHRPANFPDRAARDGLPATEL